MLDKSKAIVVGKGKDHFLTDGYVALTVNDEQAAYAGSEWGVNAKPDGDLTAKTIRELAEKNSYAAIIGNPVEIKHSLKITGKSADVYVFEVEGGKQIGVQKKHAKYFDGKRATTKKAPAKKPTKEKAVETTVRLDDFGEKIGGPARICGALAVWSWATWRP